MANSLKSEYDGCFEEVKKLEKGLLENLPNTFVYKNILNRLIVDGPRFEKLGISNQRFYLFSGESGNGRHTLADALVQSVCDFESSFGKSRRIVMGAADFMESGQIPQSAIQEHIEAIFQSAKGHIESAYGGSVFIVFDEMELYPDLFQVTSAIYSSFEEYKESKLYVILITEDYSSFCHDLLNSVFVCQCNRPGKRQREKFIKTNLQWNVNDWDDPDSEMKRTINVRFLEGGYEGAAEKTDGFSYRGLSWLVVSLRAEAVCKLHFDTLEAYIYIDIDKDTLEDLIDAYRNTPVNGQISYIPYANMAMGMPVGTGKSTESSLLSKHPDDMSVDERLEYIFQVGSYNENS